MTKRSCKFFRRFACVLVIVAQNPHPDTAQVQTAKSVSPEPVDLCVLLAKPTQYSGRLVKTVARVTGTKDVIGLWDPACGNLGADLHIDFTLTDQPGFLALHKELNTDCLAGHSIIATIEGTFYYHQYDRVKKRKRSNLTAIAVSDIHVSESPERRE